MKTFLDIVQEPEYRKYSMERLAHIAEDSNYHFPISFPLLYRYRPLSSYAVDDIINCQVTATSIGEFNDLFDGAIHRYGSSEDQLKAAKQKWSEIERHWKATNLPEGFLKQTDYVSLYQKRFKEDARLGFDFLNYLGTYVCCFSEQPSSTLMWAHYADSSKGMCITYDFNQWDTEILLRYLLFPIAYSKSPMKLIDLIGDNQKHLCKYPIDTTVLCAALNKASIWQYEHEWRMILVLATNQDHPQRLPLKIHTKPTSICFGYHFLKPFFYYDFNNKDECACSEKNIKNFERLVNYMIGQKIQATVMWPKIGSYALSAREITPTELLDFINYHFRNERPQNIRYYRTLQHRFFSNYIDVSN